MNVREHVTHNSPKREYPAANTQRPEFSPSTNSPVDQILYLQRTIGNKAVQRLIKCGAISYSGKTQNRSTGGRTRIASKSAAEAVSKMPAPIAQRQTDQPPVVNPGLEFRMNSLKEVGQPLPKSVRNYFEPRFGIELSNVRIHSGPRTADTGRSINFKAFTKGRNIIFGADQYLSANSAGKQLFSQKLRHVLQQRFDMQTEHLNNQTKNKYEFFNNRSRKQVMRVPTSLLQLRNAGAKRPVKAIPRKVSFSSRTKLNCAKPKVKTFLIPGNKGGGGRYLVNCSDLSFSPQQGEIKTYKPPDVKISHQAKANVWTIDSLVIHSLIVIWDPGKNAYPEVGRNLTNNKNDGIRNAKGKGYWKAVIRNMKNYKGGWMDRLEWWLPCTKMHESIHYNQYKVFIQKKRNLLLKELKQKLETDITLLPPKGDINKVKKNLEKRAGKFLLRFMIGQLPPSLDENEAYRITYQKCWMPAIKRIRQDAKQKGWA